MYDLFDVWKLRKRKCVYANIFIFFFSAPETLRVMFVGWSEFLTNIPDLLSVFTTLYLPFPPMLPPESHESAFLNTDASTATPSEETSLLFLDTNSPGGMEPFGSLRRRRFAPEEFPSIEQINERCFELCAILGPLLYVTSRGHDVAMTSPFDWGLSGSDVEIRFSASMENEVSEVHVDRCLWDCW